ncbi:MAG: N-acetylmuramoyl-L-alanine amidase [Eubacteriales bacterium]|nr:N-acetylmuramoyl-L-alanine amidase [Eubacteriales bacterium]
MKKPNNLMAVILFFTGILCIAFLLFFSYDTLQRITATEKDLISAMEPVQKRQQELKEDEESITEALEEKQSQIQYAKQKAAAQKQKDTQERAPSAEDSEETKPSVFSQANSSDTFTASNGHIVGIDPGHQSYEIDMSDTEPNGPGSSEMKAKASTGTQGSYTGVPEYQLNLDVSLKLQKLLEQRGYQVVMTRTDNETAISNKERAEYVAAQGAEICVRIHANGDDSPSTSGALTMAPSPDNPYVSQLSPESTRLSGCILDAYCAATGFRKIGVQYYDNMTGLNWSTIPVTILEMGFMTCESDDRQMNDPEFQDTMARGIADGIDAYFNNN